jgi:hypothetical protein
VAKWAVVAAQSYEEGWTVRQRANPKRRLLAGLIAFAAAAIAAFIAIPPAESATSSTADAAAIGDPVLVGPPFGIVGAGNMHTSARDDIIWYNSNTGETQIWFMNNNFGVFGRQTVLGENGRPGLVLPPFNIVAVGHFGGSGTADLVWYNSQTGETQIWFMNGGQVERRATVVDEQGRPSLIGPPWSIKGADYFDGNGRADLVWYNSQTGETQIWFMNGARVVGRQTVLDEGGNPALVGLPWSIKAVGFNGDIVWHNSQTNETAIWYMNNNGDRIERRSIVVQGLAPTTAPPPPPPTTAPPPARGIKLERVFNCHINRQGVIVFVADLTTGGAFSDIGFLSAQHGPSGCPAPGESPITFTLTAGHQYVFVATDRTLPGCGGVHNPNNTFCQRMRTPVLTGDTNGFTRTDEVDEGTVIS